MSDIQNKNTELNNGKSLLSKEAEIRTGQQNLRKKSSMLLIGAVILIVVLFALGIAWYTRIANTYSIKFDVADYDLAINHNVEDYYKINMYTYAAVTEKYMAPGTVGWMPLDISAEYSRVDVEYSISLENIMPEEIAKHFRFYVLADKTEKLDEDGKTIVDADTGEVEYEWPYHYGEALTSTAAIEEACTSGKDNAVTMKKIYLDDLKSYDTEYPDENRSLTIKGKLAKQSQTTLCIYWEWYLDAETACKAPTNVEGMTNGERFKVDYTNSSGTVVQDYWKNLSDDEDDDQKASAALLWDQLDTDIGRYPDKYKDALTVYIYTYGAQIQPDEGTIPDTETTTGTEETH